MTGATNELIVQLAYLVASILFILGLKGLSSPAGARNGNLMASVGMLIAVVATLLDHNVVTFPVILAGIVVGGAIGAIAAKKVQMTDMPQMVALFNGSGGGAAALVSAAEYTEVWRNGPASLASGVSILIGALIGALSLTGSIVAFAKLQGLMSEKPITYPGQQAVNGLLFLGILVAGGMLLMAPNMMLLTAFLVASALLGVAMVIPIGGGDMPVVVSLLNSFTGLATAATGFALHNNVLIISGTLVGASGTLLTLMMCKAMNRSITNVVFGAFGSVVATPGGGGPAGAAGAAKPVRDISAEDAAVMLAYSKSVIIVPGYGLAVAQAQHVCRELGEMLEKKGVDVKYAIHPVAGRMPGHMNVLLAEANVPYPQLFDLDAINPDFDHTDVALVVGANDVVNPAARTDKSSPIYGMPILDVDKAQHILVLKRSMKPGFAGVENELFHDPKTMMLFGDAKDSIGKMIAAVKEL